MIAENFPPWIRQHPLNQFQGKVREAAQIAIIDAMIRSKGSVLDAARRLGLQRTYLSRLITELELRGAVKKIQQSYYDPRRLRAPKPILPRAVSYQPYLKQTAKRAIDEALRDANGNRRLASERMGMSRERFNDYVRRFGLAKKYPAVYGTPGWRKFRRPLT